MKNEAIVKALRSMAVETGSLVCLGCGYEHHCGHYGCAIIRAAADALDNQTIEIQSLRNAAHGFQERMEAAEAKIEPLRAELTDERYRHDRLQDFEVEEAKQLTALKASTPGWINAGDRLPESDDTVPAIVSGKPMPNITFEDAFVLASYSTEDGWIVDEYPKWDRVRVSYWMPLPDAPEENHEA